MARVAAKVASSEQDLKELTKLSNSRTAKARLVERALIVLGCLAGERNDQIALRMGVQSKAMSRTQLQV
jgi:DNA-binding NarL/FixJ family response regulator